MSLRKKTLLALGATFIGLIAILYLIVRAVLLRSFCELEERSVAESLHRSVDAIENELAHLQSKASDWSNWDDTYAFIEDANPEYVTSNLTDKTFHDLGINLMLFVHPTGRIVHGKGFDLQDQHEIPLPGFFQQDLPADHVLVRHVDPQSNVAGLLVLPEGPCLLASRPILTSAGEGPVRGALVLGLYLNAAKIARLSEITRLALAICPAGSADMCPPCQAARPELSEETPVRVRPAGPDSVEGYGELKDLYGKPALMLRVSTTRDIYRKGQAGAHYLMASVLVVALVFAGLTLLLMEKLVLARVTRVGTAVGRIGLARDFSARVPVAGKDELSSLADAINTMLQALDTSYRDLRATEERFRTVVNAGMDAMIAIDELGRVTLFNPAAERMFGWPQHDALGQPVDILMPEEYRPLHRDYVQGYFQNGEPSGAIGKTVELSALHRDGCSFPVELSLSVGQHDGERFALAVVRDITERKQAEAELRETSAQMSRSLAREKQTSMQLEAAMQQLEAAMQQLRAGNVELSDTNRQLEAAIQEANRLTMAAEVANQAKSEFLANVSHEVRTPMTAILGFVDLIAEGCPGRCPFGQSELTEYVEIISRNANFLLQIISDILDLSKIEAGHLEVETLRCSAVQLVAEIDSLMRVRATAKGLTFMCQCVGSVPEQIQTDPIRLRQVLLNLLSNAIKFTETGSVRLLVQLVDGTSPDPKMQFDVLDTGIGMTEEQAARLFQPFAQADSSTTRRFGGTGLGLAISKRLAELLGGELVLLKTESGGGSHFRLTLPTGPLEGVSLVETEGLATIRRLPAPREAPAPRAKELVHRRILLAEDGPDNQRLLSFILKRAGAQVALAENGKNAIEQALTARLAGTPFDVILMDMQMPVMDGYEATRLLRREGYSHPIIALTAHAMAGDREKCRTVGCDDYAAKPVDANNLIALIRRHLSAPGAPPAPAEVAVGSELT